MVKRIIRRKIFMGDSLSDRGTLDHLKLGGVIPMSLVSGLSSKSPRGRFTNGFLWIDMLAAIGVEKLEMDHWRYHLKLKNNPAQNADLADFIYAQKLKRNRQAFTLDDDKNVLFNGTRYIRTYCEGGATSTDWKEKLTLNPGDEGARLVVSNLAAKRKQLLADDFKYKVSAEEKSETLVTEWSGANDLITVNSEPSHAIADQAVAARIENLEALIKSGYRNFVVMNLPDLGLTPRYQAKGGKEQSNASECSAYFNQQLAAKVEALKQKYKDKDLFLDVFDVSSLLTEVYNNPAEYGFDKSKLSTPFTQSQEFKDNQSNPENQAQGISPSTGYMFWDDVHPTADMHAWLAEKYMQKYDSVFDYRSPTNRSELEHGDVKKEIKRVRDQYGLDVSKELEHKEHTHRVFASKQNQKIIDGIIQKIDKHCNSLKRDKSDIAQEKAKELRALLTSIYQAKNDLKVINRLLNEKVDSDLFNVHRNPRWDKFWKKTTTRTADELRELQIAVNEALNDQEPSPDGPNLGCFSRGL